MNLQTYTRQLVQVLRRDFRPELSKLLSPLEGTTLAFRVRDDSVRVRIADGDVEVVEGPGRREDASFMFERDTLFRIVDGDLRVEEAIRGGQLDARGDAFLLVRLASAAEGLVRLGHRSESVVRLYNQYRFDE